MRIGTGSLVAVAAAALSLGACAVEGESIESSQGEVSAMLMGVPQGLDFRAGGLVDFVLVEVKKGWVNSDSFELEIEITGLNGGFEHHGIQTTLVSATTIFDTDKDTADVVVDWTMDDTPQQVNEVYTVCVQVLTDGSPFGDLKCQDFGPFN